LLRLCKLNEIVTRKCGTAVDGRSGQRFAAATAQLVSARETSFSRPVVAALLDPATVPVPFVYFQFKLQLSGLSAQNAKRETRELKMGLTGLEPVTLRLSSACSNQLSYRPARRQSRILDLRLSMFDLEIVACKRRFLKPEIGNLQSENSNGGKGIRTPDFQLAKLALYQLSYAPGQNSECRLPIFDCKEEKKCRMSLKRVDIRHALFLSCLFYCETGTAKYAVNTPVNGSVALPVISPLLFISLASART
jgi:hypothetical protein